MLTLQSIAAQFDIPLVNVYCSSSKNDMKHFFEEVKNLKDQEGYVIRFDNGHMLKVKGDWYIDIHHAIDNLRFEKNIIKIILTNNVDDVKSKLPKDLAEKLDNFAKMMFENIMESANRFHTIALEHYTKFGGDKKRFAIEFAEKQDSLDRVIFYAISRNLTKEYVYDYLVKHILDNISTSTKVDRVRILFGNLKWDEIIIDS